MRRSRRSSRSNSTSFCTPTSTARRPSCERLGARAVFENMDVTKEFAAPATTSQTSSTGSRRRASASTSRTSGRTTRASRSGTSSSMHSAVGSGSSTSPASRPTGRTGRRRGRISSSTSRCSPVARTSRGCSRRSSSRERHRASHALGRHLALAGFMGSGKTSARERGGRRTRRPFLDLDEEIEKRAGVPSRSCSRPVASQASARSRRRSRTTCSRAGSPS